MKISLNAPITKNAMQIRGNWDTRESIEKLFKSQEIDSRYIDEILNIKKYFAYQTHGILTFLVDSNGQTINPESTEISIARSDEGKDRRDSKKSRF